MKSSESRGLLLEKSANLSNKASLQTNALTNLRSKRQTVDKNGHKRTQVGQISNQLKVHR